MSVNAGLNFVKSNPNSVSSLFPVERNKEILLLVDYIKKSESKVSIKISYDNTLLTELDENGIITPWVRHIEFNTNSILPIKLPIKCKNFSVLVNFHDVKTNEGIIKIGGLNNIF